MNGRVRAGAFRRRLDVKDPPLPYGYLRLLPGRPSTKVHYAPEDHAASRIALAQEAGWQPQVAGVQ
jgi:hypothetical protein